MAPPRCSRGEHRNHRGFITPEVTIDRQPAEVSDRVRVHRELELAVVLVDRNQPEVLDTED